MSDTNHIKLIATADNPYRRMGEEFKSPAPVAENLILKGFACLPGDYETPVLWDVNPQPFEMSLQAGKKNPKSTKKTVYMATFPGRKKCLTESVPSLLPQVDEFHIWLNGYKESDPLPACMHDPKVVRHYGQNVGDIGKFMLCDKWEGYVFTCDDKLIYPPDYIQTMIQKVEKYQRKAVISAHGRVLKPNCKSYYHECYNFYGCLETVKGDASVQELGTGAMAFHAYAMKDFNLSWIEHTNMTDIYISIFLNAAKINRVVIKHNAGWIRGSQYLKAPSISTTHNKNDQLHTTVVNSIKWQI